MEAPKMETRYCTLCGTQAGKRVKYEANFGQEDLNAAVFSARRVPDGRHFRLVECEGCHMIYSDPACDPGSLARLYREAAVTYGGQESEIYESYAPVLDRALKSIGKRGTFLEIGGGNGFMLAYGARHGFAEQIEIEPSADAERKFTAPSARARFIRGIFTRGMLPPGSVSLVCFFQMLDHVPDPKSFLEAVFEVLEPGGVAVSVTHNTRALSAKVLGERSPIFDVEHTYLFNPQNMERLFGSVGFSKVETFRVSNNYALRHWLRLAPIPGKKPIASLAEKLRLADLRVKLNAGNFGVIGVKP